MELLIINIGNSKGIRIPKTILEKYKMSEKVELVLDKDCIILKPKVEPRKSWGKAFKKMHENGDDQLLIEDVFEDENFDAWSK